MICFRPAAAVGVLIVAMTNCFLPDLSASETSSPTEASESDLPASLVLCPDCEAESRFSLLDSIRQVRDGVSAAPVYTGEVFSNTRGGKSTREATRYLGLLDLPITFDFEKISSPIPGRFFFLCQNTHGEGLTDEFVGDTLVVSNIDSFKNITRVSEYWWQTGFFENAVTVRLGKQDVNTEFLRITTADDFIQSTFGLSPATAFPTYPDQSMAAVLLVKLSDSLLARFGVWDAFSSGGNWGFSGNDSVFVVGELEYAYALFNDALPGVLTVAVTYESAGELNGNPISAVHEYSIQLEQSLYREGWDDEDDRQGLTMFAGYYPRFPGALVSEDSIGDSLVAGAVYVGLIPGRDQDVVGAGVAWAELYRGGTGQETVYECFYKANVNDHLSLQPDGQYIQSPSGVYPDALVVGLRFVLTW